MMNKIAVVPIGPKFGSPFGQTKDIGDLISFLLNNSPYVAGLLLFVGILSAGISMMASAGKSDPQGAEKAKATATWAFLGFMIIFVAYWIVRIIEISTGVDFVTNPGI